MIRGPLRDPNKWYPLSPTWSLNDTELYGNLVQNDDLDGTGSTYLGRQIREASNICLDLAFPIFIVHPSTNISQGDMTFFSGSRKDTVWLWPMENNWSHIVLRLGLNMVDIGGLRLRGRFDLLAYRMLSNGFQHFRQCKLIHSCTCGIPLESSMPMAFLLSPPTRG